MKKIVYSLIRRDEVRAKLTTKNFYNQQSENDENVNRNHMIVVLGCCALQYMLTRLLHNKYISRMFTTSVEIIQFQVRSLAFKWKFGLVIARLRIELSQMGNELIGEFL